MTTVPDSGNDIVKLRQVALTMAVELAKLNKKGSLDVTFKAKELFDYMTKGMITGRVPNEDDK